MNKIQEIKKKIAKLVKSKDSFEKMGNQAEAEAFADKIQALCNDYNIALADLPNDEQENAIKAQGREINLKPMMRGNESDWVYKLYRAAAVSNNCKVITNADHNWIDIIGMDQSIEGAVFIADQLVPRLREMARKDFKTYKGDTKRNTFIRSYLQGAIQSIEVRLMNNREKFNSNSNTHSLIRMTEVSVEEFAKEKYPWLKKRLSTRSYSGQDAMNQGRATGRSISINKGVGGSNPSGRKLLN